jgi:arylsulfatase I/J
MLRLGPNHPNDTLCDDTNVGCPSGCLFNLAEDETEHHDLRLAEPVRFREMLQRIAVLALTTFLSNYTGPYDQCLSQADYSARYHGFYGPPCFQRGE